MLLSHHGEASFCHLPRIMHGFLCPPLFRLLPACFSLPVSPFFVFSLLAGACWHAGSFNDQLWVCMSKCHSSHLSPTKSNRRVKRRKKTNWACCMVLCRVTEERGIHFLSDESARVPAFRQGSWPSRPVRPPLQLRHADVTAASGGPKLAQCKSASLGTGPLWVPVLASNALLPLSPLHHRPPLASRSSCSSSPLHEAREGCVSFPRACTCLERIEAVPPFCSLSFILFVAFRSCS